MGAPGVAQLPMITLAPEQADMRLRDYSNVQRPRQEITGPAYQDRTQASPATELLTQAHHAAEYNKQVNSQRDRSGEYLQRQWRQPHEIPEPSINQQPIGTTDGNASIQALQSPRVSHGGVQQSAMSQQTPQHLMTAQAYSQASRQQNQIAQSPMRGVPQGSMRSDQIGGMPIGSGNLTPAGAYGYASPNQMWPPTQPGQSPQQHGFPTYTHGSQQSPQHIQQSPIQVTQLRHPGGNPQMQPGLQYPGMQGMAQGYPSQNRGLYSDQNSQQFMQATTTGPQPGAQGWVPQPQPGSGGAWGWTGQPQ